MTPLAEELAKRKKEAKKEKIDVKSDVTSKMSVIKSLQVVRDFGLCNDQFEPYHVRFVRRFGPQTYQDLVDLASKGKDPRKLLSFLLKDVENHAAV